MNGKSLQAVLVGGPGSGKTSYLGALWSTVQNAAPDATPRLSAGMPPRTGYLIAAETALMGGRSVGRTNRDTGERVKLDLILGGGEASIHYTDLAGETLNSVLLERKAPEDLVSDLQDSNALMLFIHPNEVRSSPTIAEGARLERSLGEHVENNPLVESGDVVVAGDKQIWADANSAIHLVELLQVCIELSDAEGEVRPIAVIVSAWDLIDPSEGWGHVKPADWLASQMPLLQQFLDSNRALHPWRAFGVSAQGFDFDATPDDADVWDLPCSERTVVVTEDDWCHEITRPIEWLLNEIGNS
jgi:hypothetical protein